MFGMRSPDLGDGKLKRRSNFMVTSTQKPFRDTRRRSTDPACTEMTMKSGAFSCEM